MKIELMRARNNHVGIYMIFACILCGVLGFFLLVSLDGYAFREVTRGVLQYSIYTVYTQFGFFIFPVLAIYLITLDYKEKNVVFYRLIGLNGCTYFLYKAITLLIYVTVGNILTSIIVSIIYKDFSNVILFFMKLENVSVFIIIISLMYAYLFKNMMSAYCVNFALWVASIVLYSVGDFFKYLCFYDASLERHTSFQKILEKGVFMHGSVMDEMIYNIVIFIMVLFVVFISKKRWIKNGI